MEVEPEVRQWLELLPDAHYDKADRAAGVFRKTQQREWAEVERAQHAQKMCEADHGPARHSYGRGREEGR